MNIETDDWVTLSEAARMLGITPSRVNQMANQGLREVVRPWPRICLIGRRSVAERAGGDTVTRLSRGTAMRRIAARHGVAGNPIRQDRLTADITRVIAGLDRKALRSELYEFVTEARPHWCERRRMAWADDLVVQVHHS
jgi:hypothetical protein